MARSEECAFFTSDVYNNNNLWRCLKVCDALVYLLDDICIRFGTKRYRQSICISVGTNCARLVADLFLFCYERDLMKSLSRENQADIIEAFNSTLRSCIFSPFSIAIPSLGEERANLSAFRTFVRFVLV